MSEFINEQLMEQYKKSKTVFTIFNKPHDIFINFQESLKEAGITILSDNEVGIVICRDKKGRQISLVTKTIEVRGHELDKLGCMYAALNAVLFNLLKDGHNCISFRKHLSFYIKTSFEDEERECVATIRCISGKDIDEISFFNEVKKIVDSRSPDEIFDDSEEKPYFSQSKEKK